MKTAKQNQKSLEEAIIDLYINLKIQENINVYDDNKAKAEKERLKKMNSFIIIEYIKTSIDILVDIKVKNQIEAFFNNYHNKLEGSNAECYEELLRKSESDIRNHIKIEHQMKIYSDNLKSKIEELEKSKAEYKKNYLALQDKFNKLNTNSNPNYILTTNNNINSNDFSDKKEREIKHLTNEIANLKVILSSYENQNNKITDLEMKLRNQQINFDKKLKDYEIKYKEQITILNNIISNYEEALENKKSFQLGKENTNISNNKRFTREFNDELSTLTINEENSREYRNTERSGSSNRVFNNSNEKYEIDECSNLTRKIEHYRKQIEKKLEKFNLKKIMNTSTTDAHSRDNISSDITIAKKSDYKDQKQKIYKYDQNPRFTEGNSSIPIFNTIRDEYENTDRYESLSNRRISKNKILSSKDLVKLNTQALRNPKSKNKMNSNEEQDEVNDLFPSNKNFDNKINKIYKKNSCQLYKATDNDEQFDLDLREFISNKMKKNGKRPIIRPGHHRSNSTNLYNY